MSLTPGARLGPYEVVAAIGVGGMGEVYRATDSQLKRSVAIKVLPAAMASDADRLARFQREAEVLAALNHQNIAAIYGLEKTPDLTALVMELVEGDDLSTVIANGARGLQTPGGAGATPGSKAPGLQLADVLPIAKQIADALEAAHEQGIVHRDLKPANIKVRSDGTVKVLDFGLAKATAPADDSGTRPNVANSPTMTSPAMTAMGMILGTAAYMSPEQAKGRAVDKRADIWAFGAVLYEMLTGRRAFEGEDVSDLLVAVLSKDVDVGALPAGTPPAIAALIRRCLMRDPKKRLRDIGDARLILEDPGSLEPAVAASSPAAAPARRPAPVWRRALPWTVAGIAVIVAGALLSPWAPTRSARPVPMHLQVGLAPADAVLGSAPLEAGIGGGRPSRTALALSSDGRWLVFAGTRAGVQQLFLRDLSRNEATPIDGTKGGDSPFLSPGGEWVGFWAAEALRKVPIGGGPVTEICKTPHINGASWGADDRIVFSEGSVLRACTAGSEAVSIAMPDRDAGETSYRLPFLLPGGRDVIFTVVSGRAANSAKIVVRSLATGKQRVLMENASDGRYGLSGHLLFMRFGTLMAVPFDPGSLAVTGTPVGLADDVMVALNAPNSSIDTAAGQFALSAAGHVIYLPGGTFPDTVGTLVWLDRQGRLTPLDTAPRGYSSPQLSPDGRRVVAQSVTGVERAVWVIDVARGSASKLRFDGLAEWPIWTPDGQRIVFSGTTNGIQNLYWMRADGSDPAERLTTSGFNQLAASWSADGRELIFVEERRETRDDIYALSMADRKTRPVLQNPAGETHPTMSPDGRWLAYVSDDSGRAEVFVTTYGSNAGRVQVSVAGGSNPRWTRDGRELVFSAPVRDGIRTIMSATVTATPAISAGVPRRLTAVAADEFSSTTPIPGFDVAGDGRLLGATRRRPSQPPPSTFTVLLNWVDELQARGRGR